MNVSGICCSASPGPGGCPARARTAPSRLRYSDTRSRPARALFPRQFRNPWPAPALNPKHSSASLWRNTGPLPPINSPAQPAAQAAQFFQTLRRGILRSGRPGGAVMRLGPGEPGAVHADTQQSYSHSPQHSALGRSNSRVRVFLGS